jgi:hypothetical protein
MAAILWCDLFGRSLGTVNGDECGNVSERLAIFIRLCVASQRASKFIFYLSFCAPNDITWRSDLSSGFVLLL